MPEPKHDDSAHRQWFTSLPLKTSDEVKYVHLRVHRKFYMAPIDSTVYLAGDRITERAVDDIRARYLAVTPLNLAFNLVVATRLPIHDITKCIPTGTPLTTAVWLTENVRHGHVWRDGTGEPVALYFGADGFSRPWNTDQRNRLQLRLVRVGGSLMLDGAWADDGSEWCYDPLDAR